MPSRKSIFEGLGRILLAAGCATVVRGYYFPDENPMIGGAYPLASITEEVEQHEADEPAGYHRSGIAKLWLFVESGVATTDALGAGFDRFGKLDDLSDAILRELGVDGLSQTPLYFLGGTVVYAESFEPWYWFQRAPENLPIVGGEMRIRFQQTYA